MGLQGRTWRHPWDYAGDNNQLAANGTRRIAKFGRAKM